MNSSRNGLAKWCFGFLFNNRNNGTNGISFTSVATSYDERLAAYHNASRRGLSFCNALMCRFLILTIRGSDRIEETVVG